MATVNAAKSGLASDTNVLANVSDSNTLACGAYNICWDVDMSAYSTGVTITGTGTHFFPTSANLTYPPSTTQTTLDPAHGALTNGATTLYVVSGTGFGTANAINIIDTATGNKESVTCSNVATNTLTISAVTGTSYPVATTVISYAVIPKFTGNTAPSKYPGVSANPPYVLLASTTTFPVTTLYVGNSTIDTIPHPYATATQKYVTIAMQGAANIGATNQYYYGWVPPSPSTHPSYSTCTPVSTTLSGNAAQGATTLNVTSTTGFIVGGTITISDAAASESNTIGSIGAGTLTVTATANAYTTAKGASVIQTAVPASQAVTYITDDMGLQVGDTVLIGTSGVIGQIVSGTESVRGKFVVSAYTNADAAGNKLTLTGNFGYARTAASAASALSANSGTASATVTTATGFIAGRRVTIKDTSNSESAVIASISGNTLTFTANLAHAYTVANGARVMHGGDHIAVYSRPIAIVNSAYSSTQNTANNGVMQGARLYLATGVSAATYGWTFTGVTIDGNGNGAVLNAGKSTLTDCVGYYSTSKVLGSGGVLSRYINCIGLNNASQVIGPQEFSAVAYGCIAQNGAGLFGSIYSSRAYDCVATATTAGLIGNGGSAIVCHNCRAWNNTYDLYFPGDATFENCTFSTVYNYDLSTNRTTWQAIQSRDHNGIVGNKYFWSRGGNGVTQSGIQYRGQNTLQMYSDATYPNTPMFWDTTFWMVPNKSLNITVPMYKTSTTVTAEFWVIDPYNDPLVVDPLWKLTPSTGDAPCTPTATNVIVRGVMPRPGTINTWQNVNVQVPAQSEGRQLTMRVIVMCTDTSGHSLYTYLGNMESAIHTKKIYMS